MLDIKAIEKAIQNGLERHLGCTVLMANQTCPIPDYPYCSYTIITPLVSDDKTWNRLEDGRQFKSFKQTWSFTFLSKDDSEAVELAVKAYDWFSTISNIELGESNIVVQSVGNITNRDNFISTMYEYREGFDVTFRLISMIETSIYDTNGIIETAPLKHEIK